MPAVANALDAHALAVDPWISPYCRAHSIQNVLSFIAVLIVKNRVRKFLSVTGGPAIVHVQRRPAVRRIHLVLEIECRTILSVRPAVNVDNQRMLGIGRHSQRLGEKGFDFVFIVIADKRERLHLRQRFSRKNLRVQVRQLARRAVATLQVKLRRVSRRRVAVRHGAVFAD